MPYETDVAFDADADIVEAVTMMFAGQDMSLADGLHLLMARIARTGLPVELCEEIVANRRRMLARLAEARESVEPDLPDAEVSKRFAGLRARAREGLRPFDDE